jgi:hypothetical protein
MTGIPTIPIYSILFARCCPASVEVSTSTIYPADHINISSINMAVALAPGAGWRCHKYMAAAPEIITEAIKVNKYS